MTEEAPIPEVNHAQVLADALKLVAAEKQQRGEVCASELQALLKRHNCALHVNVDFGNGQLVLVENIIKLSVLIQVEPLNAQ